MTLFRLAAPLHILRWLRDLGWVRMDRARVLDIIREETRQ